MTAFKSATKDHGAARSRASQAGIGAGTMVLTAEGVIPVEFLNPGDRVVTRAGIRVLRNVVMHRYSGRAIRVAPGALGSERPARDLTLPASTQILLRNNQSEALFGTAQALVPVSRIADGGAIAHGRVQGMHVYELQFDSAQIVYAEGVEIAASAARRTESPVQGRLPAVLQPGAPAGA